MEYAPVESAANSASPAYCSFCGNEIADPSASIVEDSSVAFCSTTCRSAFHRNEQGFAGSKEFKLTPTGVAPIDAELPYGLPRNSCVLLAGDEGALDAALPAELVWRTLRAGESAVIVTFNDTPVSVVEQFLLLDWNVLPYLERERLLVIDCFSRHDEPPTVEDSRRSEWVEHVQRFTGEATRTVRDPSDVQELTTKLVRALDDLSMFNSGCVAMDSLTEFGTAVPAVRAHTFLKDVRAEVCKARFVPLFGGAALTDGDSYPLDMTHAVDGRIDVRLSEREEEERLLRQLCVRKMDGVPSYTNWRHVDYAPGRGYFDVSA